MAKKRIFSGIQPTGNLHIGNYLGAIRNWVDLQNSGAYDCFFCIVDYHSLTGDRSAKERHDQISMTVIELLAAGIDPDKSTVFVQSHVPEHTELAWIFNTITPISELERMTQFKDKSAMQKQNVNVGLFTYPVLQAADILLYKATHVPVGEDQVQHVELTRDISRWFNKRYTKYFPETKAVLTKTARIKSLLEPTKKMSKSLGEGHVIELADEPSVIEAKLKKAVTATKGGEKAPGVENLLLLLKEFGDSALVRSFRAAEKNGSIRYGDLKMEVARAIGDSLAVFRERRKELLDEREQVADILNNGAERASGIAATTMEEVRRIVGVR